MRRREPRIQTLKASRARQQWGKLLDQVFHGETRIVVERNGIPVAAIISAEDLERLNRLESERERDFAILDEFGEAFKDVPDDELEQEVAKAIAQARQEVP